MRKNIPDTPFTSKPINNAANAATGCIPSVDDTIFGSIICLITAIKVYAITRPKAVK